MAKTTTKTTKTSKSSTKSLPKVVSAKARAEEHDNELRKKELVEAVVERSGIKKKYAKPVVEAMLETLGEALADGREMNLQPMGKLKINRVKQTGNGRIVINRIRQAMKAKISTKDPLAEPAE